MTLSASELAVAVAAELRRIDAEERKQQEESWQARCIKPPADEEVSE